MIDLDELEELANAATPGPWMAGTAMCCPDMGWVEGPLHRVCAMDAPKRTHSIDAFDAEFIAAARTAVPELISEVRRLEEACRKLEDLVHLQQLEISLQRSGAHHGE